MQNDMEMPLVSLIRLSVWEEDGWIPSMVFSSPGYGKLKPGQKMFWQHADDSGLIKHGDEKIKAGRCTNRARRSGGKD